MIEMNYQWATDTYTVLVVGQLVYVQGYEFEVTELHGSAIAPDGQRTYYFKGQATDCERNSDILGTGFALGNYSYRPPYIRQ